MRRVLVSWVCAVAAAAGWAQGPERLPATAALKQGPLTVWVVTPGNEAERARATVTALQKRAAVEQVAPGYKESTAGSFGKPASEMGQTAGSHGQTAGSFGKNASDVGQTAGSYGQTSSSSGKNASDTGQTAGSYGQTAGSFGQTSSTYGQSLGGASLAGSLAAAQARAVIHNAERDRLGADLGTFFHGSFEAPDASVIGVVAEELEDKLKAAEGTDWYPDIVLAETLPSWWNGRQIGLTMLGRPSPFDSDPLPRLWRQDWRFLWPTILVKAPHPLQARAFVVWFRGGDCGACERLWLANDPELADPAAVASRALQQVLAGDGIGAEADPEAAHFSANLARTLALAAESGAAPDGLDYRIDVTGAARQGPFAVISLRGIAFSPLAFGVVHAQVVLRRNDRGRWKVLQVSPNLGLDRLARGSRDLVAAAREHPRGLPAAERAKLLGVTLAAPPDDDNRSPKPDLWWDNPGGCNMLVVEWQKSVGTNWTDTRLMYVPDNDFRTQTRVTATFADSYGAYRWRVWAIGQEGALTLSPWRRLNIVR